MLYGNRRRRGDERLGRIVCIIFELLSGRTINKAELANRYGVKEKTIQRDISTIRNCLANLMVQDIHILLEYDIRRKGYYLKDAKKLEDLL